MEVTVVTIDGGLRGSRVTYSLLLFLPARDLHKHGISVSRSNPAQRLISLRLPCQNWRIVAVLLGDVKDSVVVGREVL